MSLADILLFASAASLLFIVPIAFILTRAALVRPRITVLTLFALLADGIAVLEITYVVAAVNTLVGFVLPREYTQIGFRFAALLLAMFPPLFFVAYRRRWFRDGSGE